MKKILIISCIFYFFSCADDKSNYPWSKLSFYDALALKSDKIIFLDFYSDNWGACNRLEAETLNDPRIIDFTNKHLIPIKIDAWYDSLGKELFNQYNGYAIPLLLFLDGSGEELDRVVGYKNADEFLIVLNNILNNEDTFMSLYKKYNEGNREANIIDKLASKSEDRQDDILSSELYQIVLDRKIDFDVDAIERAEYYFARLAIKNENIVEIENFIKKYINSNYVKSAYYDLIRYYVSKKNNQLEAQTYQKMLSTFLDDPSMLNSYAWRMSELEINLNDALIKSARSIELVDSIGGKFLSLKPMALDTKAEILWKLDRIDEAIEAIEQAIAIDPDYKYYQDQKLKFKNSK